MNLLKFIVSYTVRILIIICGEMVHVFHGFFGEFLHLNTMKVSKAGNHEYFLGNEGKDVEQRKFFTMNNKQIRYIKHLGFQVGNSQFSYIFTQSCIKAFL